ncbi:CoA-transferase family III [Macrolepiota fuliginosa MF-IS2]|uniref:CoA-transferase family III n=1 Tax=Macrolepiota fuliginosa MF-IS2 TaxID=1400762 RepID=A0A9P5XKL6_9AGAR|nr:CoA-transferase family III [Macrolepiota fuliginosa MF-IS2]
MISALEIAEDLWKAQGLPVDFLKHLKFCGDPDTAVQSSFKIGAVAQASIGVAGLASAYLHYLRTGVEQSVTVDARHAALEFRSHEYYTLDGLAPTEVWDTIAGLYATKDQSFVRIHTNFPRHRKGVLDILELPDLPETTKEQVGAAILHWNAEDLEKEAISRGLCISAYRSFDTWDAHPHAKTLAHKPPLTITKIGDAPHRSLGAEDRPLQGIRVLDSSRVLAGPIAGRTLAAHGADDLLITSPTLPALFGIDADTSRGKRTTQLDLNDPTDHTTLKNLISEAHVFLQAYRPGGLAAKGFGPQELAKLRPGVICANLCAWGWEGPWKDRRGFDSLVQTATGFNQAEAEAHHASLRQDEPVPAPPKLTPRPFPFQVLDYAGGYLLAFGTIVALCKSVTIGGSWEVRVSLAGVGQWLRSLGRIPPEAAFIQGRSLPPKMASHGLHPEIQSLASNWKVSSASGYSEMVALKHPAVLSVTPCVEKEAPVVLNAHEAKWL